MSDKNTKEVWKDIPGYESCYQASNLGRIKSCNRLVKYKNGKTQPIKEKILKQNISTSGYLQVSLCKNNIREKVMVHRVIAITFIENKENKPTVNHINEIKTDNRVENLEWATYKEQINCGNVKMKIGVSNKNNNNRGKNHYKYKEMEYYAKKSITVIGFSSKCDRENLNIKDYERVFSGEFTKTGKRKYFFKKKES